MRIAVLGAAGMLGHVIYRTLAPDFTDTFPVVRKSADHYAPYGIFDETKLTDRFDARDPAAVRGLLERLDPDAIVNCIGLTTRKIAACPASDVITINSVLPHWLQEWCVDRGRRLVHFSTDCVFSGRDGPYAEDDLPDAADLYGRSKALGEVAGEGILTIRSSTVGLELEGDTELLEWLRSQRGRRVSGYRRVIYSGVTTRTMATAVKKILATGVPMGGIQQLASEPISKCELLALASEILGLGVEVEPVDAPVSNKVLVPSRFFDDIGIRPSSWREQLAAVARDVERHEGWYRT